MKKILIAIAMVSAIMVVGLVSAFGEAGVGCYFADENCDGICDHFLDEDNDGICDNRQGLGRKRCGSGDERNCHRQGFIDEDGDGVCDNFGQGNHHGHGKCHLNN